MEGYITVLTGDGQTLELGYQDADTVRFVAFYQEWTTSREGWSADEPNADIGVHGAFVEVASGDSINVLTDPNSPGRLIDLVSASGVEKANALTSDSRQ